MKSVILCLILVALATSKTIPELYSKNGGQFTSDYSVTYNNAAAGGEFGFISEAGDINNDGIADFAIAHPGFDNNKGIVYVVFGKKGSLRQFNSMNDFQSSDGFIIKGNTNDQKLGFSVSSAGDVNGDGIDDLIIGSAFWNQKTGIVYVLFGRRSSSEFASTVDVDRLPSTQGFKIFGASSMDFAGYSVSGAGDLNGDGISDIAIGAFGANSNSGKVYVIFGSRQGLADMKLPAAQGKGFTVEGSYQENFGASVSKVGDFNGDGVDDLLIGAHCADGWTGRAYLIYGRRGAFPAVMKATDGMTIKGAAAGNNFGCTVSGAGDFNGDGLQDLVIGAYAGNAGNGAAYVILGNRQNPSELNMNSLSSSRGFSMISSVYSQLGVQVSGGKDLNGDGVSDIAVAAPGLNRDKGAVYVIYGARQSSFSTLVDKNLTPSQGYAIYGTREGDRFGSFVKPLRDVNRDGVNDLLVGAMAANGGKGAAYLFYVALTCSANCGSCSRTGTCDVCSPGFGFLNNECTICPSNTHFLMNGFCIMRCSANCRQCSRPNTCDVCAQGFGFLDGNCALCPTNTHVLINGVCQVKCSANCAQCSRPNTCDSCIQGYGFLDGDCIMCPSGTHILSSGFCIGKCTQNCAFCTQPGTCDRCNPGFGFLNNACQSCPSDTHFLSNGICVGVNGKCMTCPAETHTLVNGVCQVKCPENCAQCTKPNLCDACIEGFGFLNDACVICPNNKYFLNNGFCIEDHNAWQQIKDLFGGLFN